MRGSSVLRLFALGAAMAAGGCAAPSSYGPSVVGGSPGAMSIEGNQGGSWEVVLPGGSTGARLAAGPEVSRRDAGLTASGPLNVVEESLWPDPRAPHLHHLRRLHLSESPRAVHYQDDAHGGRHHHHHHRRWGW